MEEKDIEKYKRAGQIAIEVKEYVRDIVKNGMSIVELAQKIEKKIYDLGGKPAFPVSLSSDDIAAHFHPTLDDDIKAQGLLKVDLGVHVDGCIADTAISIDLTPDNKHKRLIEAAEAALENALELLSKDPTYNDIGKKIQETIEGKGFSPIINLSGHSIDKYEIHAGKTIPNYANGNENKLEDGVYAVEPFSTSGDGKIYEGQTGNVYSLIEAKNIRSPKAREILDYILEEKKTLPFCLREIQEKFGSMARLAIKELINQGVIRDYGMLIEKGHGPVAQAEHTFIKLDNEIIVTTR
jgi:methionyl aminopeptidase